MLDNSTDYPGSFQQLADARRVLKMTNELRQLLFLPADERLELECIRVLAIRCIEAATADVIDTLDVLHDPDVEGDPFNEGEPAFDARSGESVNAQPGTDPNIDAEQSAWIERVDQTQPALTHASCYIQAHEDAEDDDATELNGDESDYGGEVDRI